MTPAGSKIRGQAGFSAEPRRDLSVLVCLYPLPLATPKNWLTLDGFSDRARTSVSIRIPPGRSPHGIRSAFSDFRGRVRVTRSLAKSNRGVPVFGRKWDILICARIPQNFGIM